MATYPARRRTSARGPVEPTYLAADTCRMAKKPEPPPLPLWDVFKIASKAVWLATVEATDEQAAIEKVAKERNVPAARLLATRCR
jgi:hypothetical protein